MYGVNMDYKSKSHRGIDVPVFETIEFLRDEHGRWTQLEVKAGWYQDTDGNLYQYDGLVWDVVPSVKIEKLEYLG